MKLNLIHSFLFCALFFLLSTSGSAQSMFSFNYDHTIPLNSYQDNLHKNPQGASFKFLKGISQGRFSLGGEFGVAMYANDTYRLSLEEEGFVTEVIEVDEEDCFLHYHLISRYALFKKAIFNPYLEARLGGTSFFSSQEAVEETPNFESKTVFHGTAFNLGTGIGTSIRFGKNAPFGLDLSTGYVFGTKTDYRSIDPELFATSRLTSGHFKSTTNNIYIQAGLSFLF